MDVAPLTPVIGAEVRGVELRRLDDAAFRDVEAALLAHQVLFFRDQALDVDQHKALYAHIAKPQFQCRFRWRENSVAIWDNRCVQHLAMWDYYPETRSGLRVTVKGDRPFH